MTSRSGGSFAAVDGYGLRLGHSPATAPTPLANRASGSVLPTLSVGFPRRRVPMIHRVTGPAQPPPSFERTMMREALK